MLYSLISIFWYQKYISLILYWNFTSKNRQKIPPMHVFIVHNLYYKKTGQKTGFSSIKFYMIWVQTSYSGSSANFLRRFFWYKFCFKPISIFSRIWHLSLEIGQKSVKKSCSKSKSVPTLFAYPGTYEWGKAPKFCMDVEKGYEIVFYVSHFWFRSPNLHNLAPK